MNRLFPSSKPTWANPIGIGAVIVLVILAGTMLTLYFSRQLRVSPPKSATASAAAQKSSPGAASMAGQPGGQAQLAEVSQAPQITLNGALRQFHGLGFQFSVSSKDVRGHDLPMNVSGNKVTIGTLDGVPYYVQVFSKNPQDSLETALIKQFMVGYSMTSCNIQTATEPAYSGYPATFIGGSITPVSDPGKCPDYTTFDDNRFFLMDTKHPDKFVFIEAGQTPIDQLVSGKNWYQTISFD